MVRLTKQKKVLHDTLRHYTSFFSAEELHQKVARHNIGIATVYRFLKSMEEKGELHSYICDNRKIYSSGKKNHIHFTCEMCDQKKHLQIKNLDFLQNALQDKVCHFQIELAGICNSCAMKKASG